MESVMVVKPYPSETSSSLSAGAGEEKEKAEEKNNPSVIEEVENEMEPVKPDPSSDIPSSSSARAGEKKKEETEEENEKQSNEMEPVRLDPSSDIPSSSSARADEKKKGKMEEKEDKEEKKRKRKEKKQEKKKKKKKMKTSVPSTPTPTPRRDVPCDVTEKGETKVIRKSTTCSISAGDGTTITHVNLYTTKVTTVAKGGAGDDHHMVTTVPLTYYMCFSSNDSGASQWYTLDPNLELTAPGSTILLPFSSMPVPSPQQFRAVSGGGSLIYAIGGLCLPEGPTPQGPSPTPPLAVAPTSNVLICDFSLPNPSWDLHSSMQSPKVFPAAALSPFDNRLYVFGSSSSDSQPPLPWAEVFDSSSNTWVSLPPPPDDTQPRHSPYSTLIFDSVLSTDRNELLLFSRDTIYFWLHSFNFKDHSWNLLLVQRLPTIPHIASTVLGNVIYMYFDGDLHALDLSAAPLSLKPVTDFKKMASEYIFLAHHPSPHLSYLGNGKFCIISAAQTPYKPHCTSVRCFKFWVGTRLYRKDLYAIFDVCHEYYAHGDDLQACLAI